MKKLILSIAIIGLAFSPAFAGSKCCEGGKEKSSCETGDKGKKSESEKPATGTTGTESTEGASDKKAGE